MKIVITIDTETEEVKVVTDEKLVQSITEKEPKMVDPSVSKYARYFDEGSKMYNSAHEYVEEFLKAMDRTANELLRSKGHLFLNDVYELLGLPETKDGQIVGWIYDLGNPNGDNYVDLGIYEYRNWKALRGDKGSKILLDFNVDGVIIDKL